MKVLFQSSAFSEKLVMSICDAQMLMGLFGRSQVVKSEYVSGKGYVHTYKPMTATFEFAMVPDDNLKFPDDLKELVQVKREMMSNTTNLLPDTYEIPDEGVNKE